MEVERNGFGRQVQSFETSIKFKGVDQEVEAVFIRAMYIKSVGPGVKTLACVNNKIVAAGQDNILVTAFHPELTERNDILNYSMTHFVGTSVY